MNIRLSDNNHFRNLCFLFLTARLIFILALPLEGLRGYGDFWNFSGLVSLDWPFLDYWVEFPPFFPFLSTLLYKLVGSRQHAFEYGLVLLLSFVQAVNLYLFLQLGQRLYGKTEGQRRGWIYFALLVGLFYGWGYFDPLAVFAMLLGLKWLLEKKEVHAGVALAFGALVKWFPVLGLAVAWRYSPPRKALITTILTLGITGLVWGGLYLVSPEMTSASLVSQTKKGSWETIWALIDGNMGTGNFGADVDHTDPESILSLGGNPQRFPSWITWIPFAVLGSWFFFRARLENDRSVIAFLGLTWIVFLLWLPGYSPQWVLFLLPLILLVFDEREGLLFALTLVFVNLLEWPVLLSRGLFWGLWLTVPLRTIIFAMLGIRFAIIATHKEDLHV